MPSLSPPRAEPPLRFLFQPVASPSHRRRHMASPATGPDRKEPGSLPLPSPTSSAPGTAGIRRKKLGITPVLTETSPAPISLLRPPFLGIKVGFPSLERLMIHDMPKLRTIWHRQLGPDSFPKLKEVKVSKCDNLINIFAPSMMEKLNAIHTLWISHCKSLQLVFDVGVVLGIKEAYGTSRNQLKTFGCPNLDYVRINSCESLKNIFPALVAKGLQQLRILHVQNCGILEEIVAKEGVEQDWCCQSITEIAASNEDEQESGNYYNIAFSCLQQLRLLYLPSLRGFCSSRNCTVRVPSLNSLSVHSCLIKLKISPDGSLIQSGSRPERHQITKEVEEKEEEDDANETGGKQLIAHTN